MRSSPIDRGTCGGRGLGLIIILIVYLCASIKRGLEGIFAFGRGIGLNSLKVWPILPAGVPERGHELLVILVLWDANEIGMGKLKNVTYLVIATKCT